MVISNSGLWGRLSRAINSRFFILLKFDLSIVFDRLALLLRNGIEGCYILDFIQNNPTVEFFLFMNKHD